MKQLIYTMQFKGSASPTNELGTALKAYTSATSCKITTVVTGEGVDGKLEQTAGDQASFESEVNLSDKGTF